MPEKSQKRKLRSDQSSSLENAEITNQVSDENTYLTDQDFSDISNKIENRLSKRLRDAEFGQREILRLIENMTSQILPQNPRIQFYTMIPNLNQLETSNLAVTLGTSVPTPYKYLCNIRTLERAIFCQAQII